MATVASTVEAVKEYLSDMVSSANSNMTPLRDKCQKIKAPSDDNFRWIMKYLDNASSATFGENEQFPTAGSTSTAQAYLPYSTGYCVTTYSMTGHAMDNAMNGNFNPLALESESAMSEHNAYKEALAIAQAEAAIDKDGNYAGLVRSTVLSASYEADISTEAIGDFDTMFDTLAAMPIGCPTEKLVIYSGVAAARKYINKGLGVAYNEFNQTPGQAAQLNKMAQMPVYGQSKWELIPTMTSTVVLAMIPELMYLVEKRPITIGEPVRVNDTWNFDITSSEIFVYKNPRFAGKLTSV